MAKKSNLPHIPTLLERKLYKTGQTRGADDDEIYQNRVSRNSTVLIPYKFYKEEFSDNDIFERKFIVLLSPKEFFEEVDNIDVLKNQGIVLGYNAVVFYERREDWTLYNPIKKGWKPANFRDNPVGGEFIARIPATTSSINGEKIFEGFTDTKNKGAGIRLYEYANKNTIENCQYQLETIYWHCYNAFEVSIANSMTKDECKIRSQYIEEICRERGLLDYDKLVANRIINKERVAICPLCLEKLDANGFFNRMKQAEGREVCDLTITQLNLFHIHELRMGEFNHKPYNLGWGHHHCNVVVKDAGIEPTLQWMKSVIKRNEEYCQTTKSNSENKSF